MKKFIKILSFTLSVMIALSSLCLVSCSSEEKIELTLDNIEEYLSIEDEILDCNIDVEYENIFGIRIPNYDDSYAEAQVKINKKSANLSFEDVEISLRVSVKRSGNYPWKFKNGNTVENHLFNGKEWDDMYDNCTYLSVNLPYTGEYTKNLDLLIEDYQDGKSLLDASELRYLSITVISVSGYVIIE